MDRKVAISKGEESNQAQSLTVNIANAEQQKAAAFAVEFCIASNTLEQHRPVTVPSGSMGCATVLISNGLVTSLLATLNGCSSLVSAEFYPHTCAIYEVAPCHLQ